MVGIKAGNAEQVAALAVPAYARGERRRAVEDKLRAHFEQVSARARPAQADHESCASPTPNCRARGPARSSAPKSRAMLRSDAARRRARRTPPPPVEVEQWLSDALGQVCGRTETSRRRPGWSRTWGSIRWRWRSWASISRSAPAASSRPKSSRKFHSVADLQRIVSQGASARAASFLCALRAAVYAHAAARLIRRDWAKPGFAARSTPASSRG